MITLPQSFGLTISTGNVQGEAIHFQMSDTGTFSPAGEPLSQMSDSELEALALSSESLMNAQIAYSKPVSS